MKSRPIKKRTQLTQGATPKIVLANWIKAIFLLHQNHSQLTSYLSKYDLECQSSVHSGTNIGQCPKGELLTLLDLFEVELGKLLQDMNLLTQRDRLSRCKNHKVLIDHTAILNQLNNQAQTRIYLLSLPAS